MHSVQNGRLRCPGAVLALGIVQIILAIIIIALDLTAMFALVGFELLQINAAYTGLPVSVLLIVSGSVGIAAGVPLPPNTPAVSRRCFMATALMLSAFIMIGAGAIVLYFTLLLTVNLEITRNNAVNRCGSTGYDFVTVGPTFIQCMNRFDRVYNIGWIIAPLGLGLEALVAMGCLAQAIILSSNLKGLNQTVSVRQGIPPVNYGAYPVVYSQGPNGQQITFSQPPIVKETDVGSPPVLKEADNSQSPVAPTLKSQPPVLTAAGVNQPPVPIQL